MVAGNAPPPTTRTRLGMPLSACLARQRPGDREDRISYGAGHYHNIQPRRFRRRIDPRRRYLWLHERRGPLLDLPAAGEAAAPQRPQPWPTGPHLG